MNNNNNRNIHEIITELEAENNGTYRETLIGNFINEGRRSGLLESLLLVGSNMIINDLSYNYADVETNDVESNEPEVNNSYYSYDSNSLLRETIRNSFYDKPKYKNILSEEGEKKLNDVNYDPNIHLNESCPIFQTEFSETDIVTELPCKHVFSPHGIRKWLKEENAVCPICRYQLSYKEACRDIINTNVDNSETPLYTTLDISINEILSSNITPNPTNYNNINMFNRLLYFIDWREQQLQEEEELQQTIINSMNND